MKSASNSASLYIRAQRAGERAALAEHNGTCSKEDYNITPLN